VPGGSQQKQTNNLGHRRIGHTLPPKGCAKLPMLVTWCRLSAGRWWYRYLSGSGEYRAGLVSGARIFPVKRPPERKTSADIGEWRGNRYYSPRVICHRSTLYKICQSRQQYTETDRDGKSRPSGHFFPSHDNLPTKIASPQTHLMVV